MLREIENASYIEFPGWVDNDLYIECKTPERAREVCEAIKGKDSPLDFNRIIPLPEPAEGRMKEFWGTSRDAHNSVVEVLDSSVVHVYFDMLWYVPLLVIKALSRMFPETQITIDNECGDWPMNDPSTRLVFRNVKLVFSGEWSRSVFDPETGDKFDSWNDTPEDRYNAVEMRDSEKTAWYGDPKSGYCNTNYLQALRM